MTTHFHTPYGRALDALVADCAGYVLGTSPRKGREHYAGGEWDAVDMLDRSLLRRMVLTGMAGKVRPFGSTRPRGLRGMPTDPDTLAHAVMERGNGPSGDLTAEQVVAWYVARFHAACDLVRPERDRPEPDPLPAWVDAWVARMVCPVKREYALSAARSVYWDEYGYPTPAPMGREWEQKVWRKLGNRHVAEHNRQLARMRTP